MSSNRRRLASWALVALLGAPPILPPEPLFAAASSAKPSLQRATPAKTKSRARARRRARPPDGVCWARNAVVLDPVTNQILFDKNGSAAVPIASLSKLMTALVFLERNPDLDSSVAVTREDLAGAGHTRLRNLESVALRDLLHMSLMCSDNAATRVLSRATGLDKAEFAAEMNRYADRLELKRTHFVEVTGLDERNVATAADCARLLREAAGNRTIQEIMTKRSHQFYGRHRGRSLHHAVANTNRLLYGSYEIRGGKTGFIGEAGYCFATWIHTQSRDLIAVVLGAPTAATRFADVVRLVNHTTAPPKPAR